MRFSDIPRGARQRRGMTPFKAGILALVVIGLATFFAFTKANPFSNPYELTAIFDQVNRMRENAPVRIAGVDVGKVRAITPIEEGTGKVEVRMEIHKHGLPVKRDAQLTIRHRIFLEGNYFVDLNPGRPRSPELGSGSTVPPNQTSTVPQSHQVLNVLQKDTRRNLQRLLFEYTEALRGKGARGFNEAIRNWEGAYKNTSQVNEALLGEKEHHLTRVLKGQARVFGALSRDEERLKNLVTDLNTTMAAFASQEDNLRATIPRLRNVLRDGRPALASLNQALPEIRGFARDALPAARSSLPTLNAQIPFIRQARGLVSRRELGRLTQTLRRAIPDLTRLNRRSRLTFEQTRALSSCQNNVLVPFSYTGIPDPDFPNHSGEPYYKEAPRTLVGLSGESRLADANSPFFRVPATGGPTTIAYPGTAGEETVYSQTLLPIETVRPMTPTKRPVFRPNEPCENQEVPDLNAVGGPGDQRVQPNASQARLNDPKTVERRREQYVKLFDFVKRTKEGKPAVNPFVWTENAEQRELKRLGLVRDEDGRLREKRP
jgi:virulence factor Mce-like protein